MLNRLSLLLALSTTPALAEAPEFNLCAFVTPLTPAAEANFPDAGNETLPTPPQASSCAMAQLLSGARSYHCIWEFPYRSGAARETFAHLNSTFENCLPGQTHIRNDQSVNHPDYYQRSQYQTGPVVIGISLKDRAELHGSFVFLRITGTPPE